MTNYDPWNPRSSAAPKPAESIKPRRKKKDAGQSEAFSADETGETSVQRVAAQELRSFIERIERLEEEKATIGDDIKGVFAESKGRGYDTKAIRKIIKLRRQDAAERQEEAAVLETYMVALGMIDETEARH